MLHLSVQNDQAKAVQAKFPSVRLSACGHAVPKHEAHGSPERTTCPDCVEVYHQYVQQISGEATPVDEDPADKEDTHDEESESGSGPGAILESIVPDDIEIFEDWQTVLGEPSSVEDPRSRLSDADRELIEDLCGLAEGIAPSLAAAVGSVIYRALHGDAHHQKPSEDELPVSEDLEVLPQDAVKGEE